MIYFKSIKKKRHLQKGDAVYKKSLSILDEQNRFKKIPETSEISRVPSDAPEIQTINYFFNLLKIT